MSRRSPIVPPFAAGSSIRSIQRPSLDWRTWTWLLLRKRAIRVSAGVTSTPAARSASSNAYASSLKVLPMEAASSSPLPIAAAALLQIVNRSVRS